MVKHTENGTIRKYTIIYGKIIEKQQVFTVVWTIVIVFTMVKLKKNKKHFLSRISSKSPILEYVKKVLFLVDFICFPHWYEKVLK